jgi:hypothetical protein
MRHRPRGRRDDDDTTSKRPPVDEPARKRRKKREKLLDENPFALDPPTGTHPYVILEPPQNGVIEKPVVHEPEEPDEPAAPTPEAAPSVERPGEPRSQPIMKLPRIREEEPEEDAAQASAPAAPPADEAPASRRERLIHPHFPPTKVHRLSQSGQCGPASQPRPAEPAAAPGMCRTSTAGKVPAVGEDEGSAALRLDRDIRPPSPGGRLADYMPHFHTPTEEVPPVPEVDEPDKELSGGHTPQILRPVEDDDFDDEEGPATIQPPPGVEAPVVRIAGQRQTATPARGMRIPESPSDSVPLSPDTSAPGQVELIRDWRVIDE